MLEREGQLAIGAASVFYQGILDEIEKKRLRCIHPPCLIERIGQSQPYSCIVVEDQILVAVFTKSLRSFMSKDTVRQFANLLQ